MYPHLFIAAACLIFLKQSSGAISSDGGNNITGLLIEGRMLYSNSTFSKAFAFSDYSSGPGPESACGDILVEYSSNGTFHRRVSSPRFSGSFHAAIKLEHEVSLSMRTSGRKRERNVVYPKQGCTVSSKCWDTLSPIEHFPGLFPFPRGMEDVPVAFPLAALVLRAFRMNFTKTGYQNFEERTIQTWKYHEAKSGLKISFGIPDISSPFGLKYASISTGPHKVEYYVSRVQMKPVQSVISERQLQPYDGVYCYFKNQEGFNPKFGDSISFTAEHVNFRRNSVVYTNEVYDSEANLARIDLVGSRVEVENSGNFSEESRQSIIYDFGADIAFLIHSKTNQCDAVRASTVRFPLNVNETTLSENAIFHPGTFIFGAENLYYSGVCVDDRGVQGTLYTYPTASRLRYYYKGAGLRTMDRDICVADPHPTASLQHNKRSAIPRYLSLYTWSDRSDHAGNPLALALSERSSFFDFRPTSSSSDAFDVSQCFPPEHLEYFVVYAYRRSNNTLQRRTSKAYGGRVGRRVADVLGVSAIRVTAVQVSAPLMQHDGDNIEVIIGFALRDYQQLSNNFHNRNYGPGRSNSRIKREMSAKTKNRLFSPVVVVYRREQDGQSTIFQDTYTIQFAAEVTSSDYHTLFTRKDESGVSMTALLITGTIFLLIGGLSGMACARNVWRTRQNTFGYQLHSDLM